MIIICLFYLPKRETSLITITIIILPPLLSHTLFCCVSMSFAGSHFTLVCFINFLLFSFFHLFSQCDTQIGHQLNS